MRLFDPVAGRAGLGPVVGMPGMEPRHPVVSGQAEGWNLLFDTSGERRLSGAGKTKAWAAHSLIEGQATASPRDAGSLARAARSGQSAARCHALR
jgi:hypothetical protein